MRSVSTSRFAVAPRTVVNSPLPSGTLDFGPAAIPGGSASPAPGTYALLAGLAALGGVADRRRSRPR